MECVSEQALVSSSQDSLSSFVQQAILVVPKKNGATFTRSEHLVFRGFICGGGIKAGDSVDLVYLFDILITPCFVGLGSICDAEYVFTMKVLISLLN